MGVDRTDYIMVGCNVLSNEKYFEGLYGEDWLDEIFTSTGLDCIYDGMSGEYCMLGKIISEAERYEGMYSKIDLEQIADMKTGVKNTIKEKLNLDVDPELYVFTHFY